MTGTDVATYVREKPGMSAFATRQPTGGVATTSTTSAERRPGCRDVTADETQTSWHTCAGATCEPFQSQIGR